MHSPRFFAPFGLMAITLAAIGASSPAAANSLSKAEPLQLAQSQEALEKLREIQDRLQNRGRGDDRDRDGRRGRDNEDRRGDGRDRGRDNDSRRNAGDRGRDNDRRDARERGRDDDRRRDARDQNRDNDRRRDARDQNRDNDRRRDARSNDRDDDRRMQERRQNRAERVRERRERRREVRSIKELKAKRKERREGGRVIIEEPDNRRIVRENGRAIIRSDETDRLRRRFNKVTREKRDGRDVTIAIGAGGVKIYTEFDDRGRPRKRWRRGRDGRDIILFDNSRSKRWRNRDRGEFIIDLPAPRIGIARDKYIVDYDRASEDDIYDALSAPPVVEIDDGYSIDEIRYSHSLRNRLRRIDLDTINFAFGSWEVQEGDYDKLERMARAMRRVLRRNSAEMFLIEGHTDAVGSDEDNLTLSDRRAEEVATILTEEFDVPAENLTTQGYGEQFLKIETDEPERENRRVAVRRITPLLAR